VDQGVVVKMKSSLRLFYGHNRDLVYCLHNKCVTDNHGYIPFVLSFFPRSELQNVSPNITYHRIGNMNNAKSAKNGSEIAYLTRPQEFTPSFRGVKVAQYLFFCVVYFVFSVFVFYLLPLYIVLLAIRTTCI
jgi:hypothetical protein